MFGSNTEGRHGKGNALVAKTEFGAIHGTPEGLQGRSYGIMTTDLNLKRQGVLLDKKIVIASIKTLYEFATKNPEYLFFIAYSMEGRLLSGFTHDELIQMLSFCGIENIPTNIVFEKGLYNHMSDINLIYDQASNA